MGNALWNALGLQSEREFAEFAESEITATRQGIGQAISNTGALLQDTERTGFQVIDNARADILYSARDFKSETLHLLDSVTDNMAFVVQDVQKNIANTIQMSFLLGSGAFLIFIIMYPQVFDRPVKLGRLSLF